MTGPTVLATRSAGLGDLCTAVPALRALRRAYPDHRLVLATPERLRPIACAVGIDAVVDTEELAPLPDDLRGVEVAVNLHGSGPQSIERLLALRPQRLITHRHAAVPASREGPAWEDSCHEVERWCRLVAHAGIPADPRDIRIDPPSNPPAPGTEGSVIVHPGAAAPGRRWPAERFAEVVRRLTARGTRVTLTGSHAERDTCARIAASVPVDDADLVRDIAGRTDLATLLATVATARAVLCNDTGVAHLAVAVGTPSVVLFGPTPPDRWGPPPWSGRHRAIWKGRCGDPHAEQLHPGLAMIQVPEVLAALADVAGNDA